MRNAKVKLLAILLTALVLPAGGLAETVREQVDAPESVHATFTSNTGKTVISVDASITVPCADKAYIIPVSNVYLSQDQLRRLAELFQPGIKWKESDESYTAADYSNVCFMMDHKDKANDIRATVQAHYDVFKDGLIRGEYVFAEIRYDDMYRRKMTVNFGGNAVIGLVGDAGIAGHALNAAEATDVMDSFVAAITDIPMDRVFLGMVPGTIYDDELLLAGTESDNTGESYTAGYTRKVLGMPLVYTATTQPDPQGTSETRYVASVGYESISVVLDAQGNPVFLAWRNPITVREKEAEECTLLPYTDVMAVAEKILPLKYTSQEATEENVRYCVYQVILGYLAVIQPDTMESALTPAWVFYGYDQNLHEKYPRTVSIDTPLIAINAISGTVIDLSYGY